MSDWLTDHGQRPPARPAEGGLWGCIAAAVTGFAVIGGALLWRYGLHAVAAAPLAYGWGVVTDLRLLAGADPDALAVAGYRWVAGLPGWLYAVTALIAATAGIATGIETGRAPPGMRLIGGRRVEQNPKKFAAALRTAGEAGDGLRLHPAVPTAVERERRHALLVAGTGAGKTQVLLPLIEAAGARGDLRFIYDYKGDLTATHYTPDVALLAPWDARGMAWDVSADVPDLAAARELAAALIPPPSGGDPVWSEGARQIMVGLIRAQQARGHWSLADLSAAASAPAAELAAVLRHHLPEAAALLAHPESRTAASFIANLVADLGGLHDLARAWSDRTGPRFSVTDWLDGCGPETVIVQHSESDSEMSRMLLRMLMRLVVQRVGDPSFQRAASPTWLFLDEFLQAGKVAPLLSIAEVARSKDVRLVLAAQTISRIRDIYGREQADALASTVGTVMIGRSRGETAKWASEQAGQHQIERWQRSVSAPHGGHKAGSSSTHWRAENEPVMRPAEFDATLGVRGRGARNTRIRMLMLAGGNTIGLLDWRLTRLAQIAPAHVPVEPTPAKGTDADESDESPDPESDIAGGAAVSKAPEPEAPAASETSGAAPDAATLADELAAAQFPAASADTDETPAPEPKESPRERLRRRRAAAPAAPDPGDDNAEHDL